MQDLFPKIPSEACDLIRKPDRFFWDTKGAIRVIVDAIDGTVGFTHGLPLFCSSLAIFVEDQLRVSAIYDPLHHAVYSAVLSGPSSDPSHHRKATLWQIAVGALKNLVPERRVQEYEPELKREVVGVHFPRNDQKKRDLFIGYDCDRKPLAELANRFDTVYALNCGELALAEVARGGLSAFVNVTTKPWDTAAGQVLVEACGGKVTDCDGSPIDYTSPDRVSVVAARDPWLHRCILDIVRVQPVGS